MAKKPAPESDTEGELPIVRDATFTRVVADHTAIMNLGRDCELAFLQSGSEPKTIAIVERNGKMAKRFKLIGVMVEVVRVRMSPHSAGEMAINILESLIAANQADSDIILNNVREMIASIKPEVGE